MCSVYTGYTVYVYLCTQRLVRDCLFSTQIEKFAQELEIWQSRAAEWKAAVQVEAQRREVYIRPLIWYGRCPIWYWTSYLYIRPLIWYRRCPIWYKTSYLLYQTCYLQVWCPIYTPKSCSNDSGILTHLAPHKTRFATGVIEKLRVPRVIWYKTHNFKKRPLAKEVKLQDVSMLS